MDIKEKKYSWSGRWLDKNGRCEIVQNCYKTYEKWMKGGGWWERRNVRSITFSLFDVEVGLFRRRESSIGRKGSMRGHTRVLEMYEETYTGWAKDKKGNSENIIAHHKEPWVNSRVWRRKVWLSYAKENNKISWAEDDKRTTAREPDKRTTAREPESWAVNRRSPEMKKQKESETTIRTRRKCWKEQVGWNRVTLLEELDLNKPVSKNIF